MQLEKLSNITIQDNYESKNQIQEELDMSVSFFSQLPSDISTFIYRIYYKNVVQELMILHQLKKKRICLKKNNKMYTNESVVIHWLNNCPHNSYKRDQRRDIYLFYTDGNNLYSNEILIGFTKKGKKIIYDLTASNDKFISYTCSRHINLAKKYCDSILS